MSNSNWSGSTIVNWETVQNGVDVVKVGTDIHYRPKPGKNMEKRPAINLNTIPRYENVLKAKGGKRRTRNRRSRRSRTRSRK